MSEWTVTMLCSMEQVGDATLRYRSDAYEPFKVSVVLKDGLGKEASGHTEIAAATAVAAGFGWD